MPKISVTRYGEISPFIGDKILAAISECYKVIGEPVAESIDLCLVEKAAGETFFATHDALQGKPRISVYVDKFLEMPDIVGLAGIRRQAAHSVLHGSLKYYLIKFPEELIRAMKQYDLPQGYANSLLYGTSMAVKEYGVTKLLYEKDFVDDQIAYAKYILDPSSEEVLAWEVALRNRLEKILYLVSIIRDISCAVPLIQDEQIGGEIKNCIEGKLAHIAPAYRSRIQEIIYEKFFLLGTNTLENIELVTKFVVEGIVDPELRS
jgi:hypothetical protein